MSYFRLNISTKELFFWDGKNRQSGLPEKFFF